MYYHNDFMTEEQICERYNDAVADLAIYSAAVVRGDAARHEKDLRNAGEGMSQALEGAVKYHMKKHLDSRECSNALNRFQLPVAIGDFYWDEDNDYEMSLWTKTLTEEDSKVDFVFIKNNRNKLTNESKHKGGKVEFDIVERYMHETALFIKDYIMQDAPLRTISDYNQPEIDKSLRFYTTCDKFITDDRTYVLVVDTLKVNKAYLSQLSRVKWSVIICLDPNAEECDFIQAAYKNNNVDYRPLKLSDNVVADEFSVYSEAPNVIFANGFHQVEPTYSTYREWNKKKNSVKLDQILSELASVYCTQKTITISLLEDKTWTQGIYDILDRNFNHLLFVIGDDERGELRDFSLLNPNNVVNPEISLQQIDQCFTNFLSAHLRNSRNDEYRIPCRSEGDGILTATELARLEENFEVLYDGIDEGNDEIREDFLRGHNTLSWEGAKRQFAVKRNNFNKLYLKQLDSVLKNARGQLMIIHEPGFGGTTIARQLGYYYHKDYPVLFLKSYTEDLLSQLDSLQQKTKTIIMVFMEIPQTISFDDFVSLYRRTNDTRPFVFIGIQRGDISQELYQANKNNTIPVLDWGGDVGLLVDVYRPYLEYFPETVKKQKEDTLERILTQDVPSYMRTPFYLGLLAFDEKFEAIDSYINNFAVSIKNNEQKRKVLIYLAICDQYAHKSLPEPLFASVFMTSSDEVFKLEDYFHSSDGIINSLLSKTQKGGTTYWTIRHPLFSKYLLKTLLQGDGLPTDIGWKFNLGKYCQSLIQDAGNCDGFSDILSDLLKDLFIGSSILREGETFTEIVNLMQQEEQKLIFRELHETYPDNPHFCSHLGRYYAKVEGNKQEALKYVNLAISMNGDDPLLHHIKGTCLQAIIYDLMDKIQESKHRTGKYDEQLLYQIMDMYEQAAHEFGVTRTLYKNKQREDLHGYISQIQLLIKLFDFTVKLKDLKKQDVIASVKEPYFTWLEEAQNLLDDACRQNIGEEDMYVQDCNVNLWSQYENPSKIIESLNNQLNTTKYPALVRRQIARLYLHNEDKYKSETRINRRILDLMEDNISAEPANEKNFYLWFMAARYSMLRDDEILSNLSKWRALNPTLNITFYNYVFTVLKALDGSTEAAGTAISLFNEMRRLGGYTSTNIREWYSRGPHHISKYSEVSQEEFSDMLIPVEGQVMTYDHEGSASIFLDCGLKVFFKPVTSKLDRRCLNRKVQFYLGFSYEGLRAADGSVVEL